MMDLAGLFNVPFTGIAYRAFRYREGKLNSIYFAGSYVHGIEYEAPREYISFLYSDGRYQAGFHMFADKKWAEKYFSFLKSKNENIVLTSVRYKNPVGFGYMVIDNRDLPCFTAQWMSLS